MEKGTRILTDSMRKEDESREQFIANYIARIRKNSKAKRPKKIYTDDCYYFILTKALYDTSIEIYLVDSYEGAISVEKSNVVKLDESPDEKDLVIGEEIDVHPLVCGDCDLVGSEANTDIDKETGGSTLEDIKDKIIYSVKPGIDGMKDELTIEYIGAFTKAVSEEIKHVEGELVFYLNAQDEVEAGIVSSDTGGDTLVLLTEDNSYVMIKRDDIVRPMP